jgi:hypothetical protein
MTSKKASRSRASSKVKNQNAMGSVVSSASASAAAETSAASTVTVAKETNMNGPSQASNFIVHVRDLHWIICID